MNYDQDTIEVTAKLVADGVPRFVIFKENPMEGMEMFRRKWMNEALVEQVRALNGKCGSRKRKSLESVGTELTNRDIEWMWGVDGNVKYLVARGGDCSLYISYDHGLGIALSYDDQKGSGPSTHCTAGECDLADLVELMFAVDVLSRKLAERKIVTANRDRMLGEITFPSIELDVARFLEPRGVRYILKKGITDIILEVQIVNEYWMKKSLNIETLEDDLRIIPYLINRPDCIKRDGRGFEITYRWEWKKR